MKGIFAFAEMETNTNEWDLSPPDAVTNVLRREPYSMRGIHSWRETRERSEPQRPRQILAITRADGSSVLTIEALDG